MYCVEDESGRKEYVTGSSLASEIAILRSKSMNNKSIKVVQVESGEIQYYKNGVQLK